MYLHKNIWYNKLFVFILYCKTLLLLRWDTIKDTIKVKDRFLGLVRFKGGLNVVIVTTHEALGLQQSRTLESYYSGKG